MNNLPERPEALLKPQFGYDSIAAHYERWHWFEFWRHNEAPIVKGWLTNLDPGFGLDAGSGTGPYLLDMSKMGHQCVAIDLSWEMLRINRAKTINYPKTSLAEFVQGDISALPFKAQQFNWVLSSRVLSHVSNIHPLLADFARVLKQGGECLITDVHPEHPYATVTIPVDGKKIEIETHKHSLQSFKAAISSIPSFRVLNLDEYHFKDLQWKPPKRGFGKLYDHSNPALFWTTRLKKV